MTDEAFELTLTNDGLPVALAQLVIENNAADQSPYAYMEVLRCPFCGGRHIHSAEKIFRAQDGRLVAYAPSYTHRQALCGLEPRQDWQKRHPEVGDYDTVYALVPAETIPTAGG